MKKYFSIATLSLLFAQLATAAEDSGGIDIIHAGGWTLKIIILLSFIAVVMTFFFLFSIRKSVVAPTTFANDVESAIDDLITVMIKIIEGISNRNSGLYWLVSTTSLVDRPMILDQMSAMKTPTPIFRTRSSKGMSITVYGLTKSIKTAPSKKAG